MAKKYLLDSNVFFEYPDCIFKFEDNEIYTTFVTLEELDNHKGDNAEKGYKVREAIRNIEKSDKLKFLNDYDEIRYDTKKNDNKIIAIALKNNCIIVSNDVAMRIKCRELGIPSEEYRNSKKFEIGNIRKGKHYVEDEELLAKFYENQNIIATEDMYENDYVLFTVNSKVVQVGIVKNRKVIRCDLMNEPSDEIKFKNLDQKLAFNHINNQDLELISITGSPGVGKNFITIFSCLELIDKGVYDKLYICKAPIPIAKEYQLGYRPSDFISKVMPTLGSFTSNLHNLKSTKMHKKSGVDLLLDYVSFGLVEIVDLENIQGVSLPPKSILILDEFQIIPAKGQNAQISKAVLSRIGCDSLIICLGDLIQMASNKHGVEDSALHHLIEVFSGYDKYAHIVLDEVVRSNFVAELEARW